MSYRDHNERALAGLDRWLTTPPEAPEPPEEAYCEACGGEGVLLKGTDFPVGGEPVCPTCNGTGIDPVWEAEAAVSAKREDDAVYEAYLESQQYEYDLDNARKEEGE